MKLKTATAAQIMGVTGTVVFGIAVVQFAITQLGLLNGHPFDPAVTEANSTMIVVGMVASLAAYSLKKVEARLSGMETAQPTGKSDDTDTAAKERQQEGGTAVLRAESSTASRLAAREILGLLIRVVGLSIAAFAIYDELFAILEAGGFIPQARYPASRHGFFGILYFLIGIVIVKTADHIVNFSYGNRHIT